MRRKAPTTRIAEGGLSTEERVARYTRFPDLKPPNAADALTADEYGASPSLRLTLATGTLRPRHGSPGR